MNGSRHVSTRRVVPTLTSVLAAGVLVFAGASFAADGHSTGKFQGIKANTGTATHGKDGGKDYLTVSDDFKIPDTPAPHWQVVDSKGNAYLLNQLRIKDGKTNRKITVPSYVHDVAKVQIWCSFAEAFEGKRGRESLSRGDAHQQLKRGDRF